MDWYGMSQESVGLVSAVTLKNVAKLMYLLSTCLQKKTIKYKSVDTF